MGLERSADRDAVLRSTALENGARLAERGRYDEAVAQYRSLVRADPRDARTLLKLGDLQCKRGAYEEAIEAYVAAGDVFVAQGHALKAIASYKKVRLLIATNAPQLEEPYAALVFTITELYRQLGLTSDALSLLDEVATGLERRGRIQEAIAILRHAAELDRNNPSRQLRLAEALSDGEDSEGAATELGDAASRLVAMGRCDEALAALERLLDRRADPSSARAAAELYLARKTPDDAICALRRLQLCVRADPKDVATLHLLARAFAILGHHEKVEEVKREIALVRQEQGLFDVAPPSSREALASTDERGVVQVIPVTEESWNAIAARLQKRAGEHEQVIAFVCAPGGDGRSTMRTIYGVVKTLFA